MVHIIKCPHCNLAFFSIEGSKCPFCKRYVITLSDIFNDNFGNQNNPFQDFTNQGDKSNEIS